MLNAYLLVSWSLEVHSNRASWGGVRSTSPVIQTRPACSDLCRQSGKWDIRPFATRSHDFIEKVGIDISTIDILVQSNISPWQTPNFTLMEAWIPSAKAIVAEVEVRWRFREILNKHPYFHIYTNGSKTEEWMEVRVCELNFRLPIIHLFLLPNNRKSW